MKRFLLWLLLQVFITQALAGPEIFFLASKKNSNSIASANVAKYWLTTGGLLTDTGAQANNITLTNNGTVTNANGFDGSTNTAGLFNGTNQSLSVTNSLLSFSGAFSVVMHAYPTTVNSANHYLIGHSNSLTGNIYGMAVSTTNVIDTVIQTNVATYSVIGTTTITANTWYCVAMTWDGTTNTLYLNGNVEGTPVTTSGTLISAPATGLFLGRNGGASNGFFAGRLDDVWLENIALTQTQVQTICNYAENF